jgi:hypothetical protein
MRPHLRPIPIKDRISIVFLYAIALAFTFLWTSFLWGIFYSEGNLTWEIRLACFLIGLILHIPFVLLTFRIQKPWFRMALAIVLIPVLLVHFGFLVMLWDSLLLAGGWTLCVIGVSYYQLFKGVVHDQKSN